MDDNDLMMVVQVVTCAYMTLLCATAIILKMEEDEREERPTPINQKAAKTAAKLSVLRSVKRRLDIAKDAEDEEETNKKSKKTYNYERAKLAIQEDYMRLEPPPLFEHHFVRIFRVTRSIVERIITVAGNADPYFTQRYFLTGEAGICPEAKVLIGLKQLAFGVSSSAFLDYFQMGLTSGRNCLRHLSKIIATSEELRGTYLRDMTKADAIYLSKLHEEEFGVPGCVGCLDCMHVYWRTCPVAWQGQYAGKEKKASIVLEAVADYNCRFWHTSFGAPGTLNDINIWDRSRLLKLMLDGTFIEYLDFDFTINSKIFCYLWLFVDGIYPEIARFVKTISVPLGRAQKAYVKWQESSRKSVERAFGVLQRKFQILQRPQEIWYQEEITHIVEACLILHNMMVEVRLNREEREQEQEYDEEPHDNMLNQTEEDEDDDDQDDQEEEPFDPVAETRRQRRRNIPIQWPTVCDEIRVKAVVDGLKSTFRAQEENWHALYDESTHYNLRDNIIEHLNENRKKEKENKKRN